MHHGSLKVVKGSDHKLAVKWRLNDHARRDAYNIQVTRLQVTKFVAIKSQRYKGDPGSITHSNQPCQLALPHAVLGLEAKVYEQNLHFPAAFTITFAARS